MTFESIKKKQPYYFSFIAFVGLLPLLFSPILECLIEWIDPPVQSPFFGPEMKYPFTMDLINSITECFTLFLWFLVICHVLRSKNSLCSIACSSLPHLFFGGFIFWMLLSTFFSGDHGFALQGHFYRNESLLTFALYFAGYFFLGSLLTAPRFRKWTLRLFVLAGTSLSLLTLCHVWIISIPFLRESNPSQKLYLSSIFYNSNHYAYYLTLSVLLSAGMYVTEKSFRLRISFFFAFMSNFTVLIIADTLGSYLAVMGGLSLMLFLICFTKGLFPRLTQSYVKRHAIIVFCSSFALSFILSFFYHSVFSSIITTIFEIGKLATNEINNAGSGRWKLWKLTISYIKEKPLFGHGIEGIGPRLEFMTRFDRPHNEYLQYAAFWGIPSLIFYLSGCGISLVHSLRNAFFDSDEIFACAIASVGYLASAFFGNTMYYTTPFFFVLLGIVASGPLSHINLCSQSLCTPIETSASANNKTLT